MTLSYGEKIKQYRTSKGITQEELAEQLSISVSMLRMIEIGQRKPNREVQKEIYSLTDILYTDEIKSEIDTKLNELIINYMANEINFFNSQNISSLIRILSETHILMHPTNRTYNYNTY